MVYDKIFLRSDNKDEELSDIPDEKNKEPFLSTSHPYPNIFALCIFFGVYRLIWESHGVPSRTLLYKIVKRWQDLL